MNVLTKNLKMILDNLYDCIYIVDKNRKIIYWNKAAEKLTGYTESEIVGSYCYDNILNHINNNGTKLCGYCCPLARSMKGWEVKKTNVFFHHKDGHRVPTSIKILPYRDEDDEIIGAIEIFSENFEQKYILKKIKELEKLSMLDELTQMPNRRYVQKVIKMKLKECRLTKINFGLIFIDIDNFKKVNDNYGHDVGDLVLKTISKTLSNNLREEDTIGRWGGEEFIGVFSEVNEEILKKLAEKLRMLVENTVIKINGKNIKVTISIGATIGTSQDDMNTLIKKSDDLLYYSKKNGKNCVTID